MTSALSGRDMARIALMSVVIAVSSWLVIPAPVPFTMQTFAVFLTLMLLGGRKGCYAVTVYVLLGAVGIPVFSGAAGGIGHLLGATGGYIFGFIFMALVYRLVCYLWKSSQLAQISGCVIGLLVCYAVGTVWFVLVYTRTSGAIGFKSALSMCVLPFIVYDAIKLALACVLSTGLKKHLKAE